MIVAIYHIHQALYSYLLYFSRQIYNNLFVQSQLLHGNNNLIAYVIIVVLKSLEDRLVVRNPHLWCNLRSVCNVLSALEVKVCKAWFHFNSFGLGWLPGVL